MTETETNRATSAKEVLDFKTRPEAGPYTGYLSSDGRHITTWMGDVLATVTSEGCTFKAYGANRITPFRALGIDGRVYYGRHNGRGMHLRMRPLVKTSG